jgi:signal transduction histidine kinase
LNTPETIQMFEMFADVIGFQLSAIIRMDVAEANLLDLQNASALREQFIAVLGHDLRNPLASISGGASLLRKEALSERGLQILNMMHGSVVRMSCLIDNVLDFARGRLGGGVMLTREASVALEPILQQVVNELRIGATGRSIETDFALPERVNCDPSRLGQMVSNLLANALTHGAPDEPVRIHATTNADELELWVANGGAPIPPTTMERLFQPFFRGQVRPSLARFGARPAYCLFLGAVLAFSARPIPRPTRPATVSCSRMASCVTAITVNSFGLCKQGNSVCSTGVASTRELIIPGGNR